MIWMWCLTILSLSVNTALCVVFLTFTPLFVVGVFCNIVRLPIVQKHTSGWVSHTVENMQIVIGDLVVIVMRPLGSFAFEQIESVSSGMWMRVYPLLQTAGSLKNMLTKQDAQVTDLSPDDPDLLGKADPGTEEKQQKQQQEEKEEKEEKKEDGYLSVKELFEKKRRMESDLEVLAYKAMQKEIDNPEKTSGLGYFYDRDSMKWRRCPASSAKIKHSLINGTEEVH